MATNGQQQRNAHEHERRRADGDSSDQAGEEREAEQPHGPLACRHRQAGGDHADQEQPPDGGIDVQHVRCAERRAATSRSTAAPSPRRGNSRPTSSKDVRQRRATSSNAPATAKPASDGTTGGSPARSDSANPTPTVRTRMPTLASQFWPTTNSRSPRPVRFSAVCRRRRMTRRASTPRPAQVAEVRGAPRDGRAVVRGVAGSRLMPVRPTGA